MRTLKDRVRNWLPVAGYGLGVKNPRRGYTLMELLVVIAIIAILAGLIMPALRAARHEAMEARAKSMIASLQMALSMYETDYGVYPPSALAAATPPSQRNGNSFAPEAPLTLVAMLTATTGGGPYMEFKGDDIVRDAFGRRVLIDPWGRAYVYVSRKYWDTAGVGANSWQDVGSSWGPFHPDTNPLNNSYNIYSLGLDGKTYREANFLPGTDWNVPGMFDHINDGHTAAWVKDDANLKYLLDDINSWE